MHFGAPIREVLTTLLHLRKTVNLRWNYIKKKNYLCVFKIFKKIQMLMKKLEELKEKREQNDSGEEIKRVEKQIHNLLVEEEIYWK